MASKNGQVPIPNDWQEEDGYILAVCCVPNSPLWRANFRGAVYNLTRGRYYDFSTGIFKDIEQIANDLHDGIQMCNLEDLIKALDRITKSNIMLMAAVTSSDINFSNVSDLEAWINVNWQFQGPGLANRVAPSTLPGGATSLQATIDRLTNKLDEVKLSIEAGQPVSEDLEDDLANVWKQLEGVVEILGKTPELPPEPL